ncbi:hypothetical protein, partial [Mesorhizobium sp. M0029]|uniref:hypothetical protein n=1 Tax=Mesorhizobium sp. M0029 TaxID=2956850 RepID=UPI0033379F8D
SIWTTCASTRSSLCAKPHDQHHGRPILQNLTHTTYRGAKHLVLSLLFAQPLGTPIAGDTVKITT